MALPTPARQPVAHSPSTWRVPDFAGISCSHRTQLVTWLKRPFIQRLLLLIVLALVALSLGNWLLSSSHTSFAQTTSFEVCAAALGQQKAHLCTGADPVQGGCAADAQTITHLPIRMGNQQIGLGELRYSPQCQTDWGRGFSYLPGTTVSVFIADPTSTYNALYISQGPEAYSNMVFGKVPIVIVGVVFSPQRSVSVQVAGV